MLVSLLIVLYALAGMLTALLWAKGLSNGLALPFRWGGIVAGVFWPVPTFIVIADNIGEVLGRVNRHT